MTIEEAVQLVIQAGAIGRPGEVLVLDMGKPVRIADVAEQLIALGQGRVPIEFTGLRQGEKLHEELLGDHEPREVRPWHPLISHVPVEAIDLDLVASLPVSGRRSDVSAAMAQACAGGRGPEVLPRSYGDMEDTVVHAREKVGRMAEIRRAAMGVMARAGRGARLQGQAHRGPAAAPAVLPDPRPAVGALERRPRHRHLRGGRRGDRRPRREERSTSPSGPPTASPTCTTTTWW